MFSFESGVDEVMYEAVERYKKHFEKDFPLHEYTDVTSSEEYDFSIAGAKRLTTVIDEMIANNKPAPEHDGRMY